MNKMVSMKLLMIVLVSLLSQAQADEKQVVMDYLDQHSAGFSELAMSIWDYAELGYLEMRSSALLQKTLPQSRSTGRGLEKQMQCLSVSSLVNWPFSLRDRHNPPAEFRQTGNNLPHEWEKAAAI